MIHYSGLFCSVFPGLWSCSSKTNRSAWGTLISWKIPGAFHGKAPKQKHHMLTLEKEMFGNLEPDRSEGLRFIYPLFRFPWGLGSARPITALCLIRGSLIQHGRAPLKHFSKHPGSFKSTIISGLKELHGRFSLKNKQLNALTDKNGAFLHQLTLPVYKQQVSTFSRHCHLTMTAKCGKLLKSVAQTWTSRSVGGLK